MEQNSTETKGTAIVDAEKKITEDLKLTNNSNVCLQVSGDVMVSICMLN